jgi:hypothetical protein
MHITGRAAELCGTPDARVGSRWQFHRPPFAVANELGRLNPLFRTSYFPVVHRIAKPRSARAARPLVDHRYHQRSRSFLGR